MAKSSRAKKCPNHILFAIHITERLKNALKVQKVLTEYGKLIKTRLGLHEIEQKLSGLLILEMVSGSDTLCEAMLKKLEKIEGIAVQKVTFDHP